MKYFLPLLTLLYSIYSYSQDYVFDWLAIEGGVSEDIGYNVHFDRDNNLIVCGNFSDTAFFDGTQVSTHGLTDAFIAKYDTTGQLLWIRTLGGSSSETALSVAFDSENNLYVAGTFRSSFIYVGDTILESCGCNYFSWLAKYDSDGAFLWARSLVGSSEVKTSSIAVDNHDNIYMAGFFVMEIYFPNGDTVVANGFPDIFLVKYDHNGNYLLRNVISSAVSESVADLTTDDDNNIYVTGYFTTKLMIGDVQVFGTGGTDIYLVKMDSVFNTIWAVSFGGNQWDEPTAISLDHDNNIVVAGFMSDTLFFNNTMLISSGYQDNLVAKFDNNGNELWAAVSGGVSEDVANDIVCDDKGEIFVTGVFRADGYFGDTILYNNLFSNVFILEYSPQGEIVWAKQAGGNANDFAYGITEINDALFVTGDFRDMAEFGQFNVASTGDYEIFFSKLKKDNLLELSIFQNNEQGIILFPNPANDHINVKANLPEGYRLIEVFDTQGKLVYENRTKNVSGFTVDLSEFKSGLYLLKATTTEKIFFKSFVKK